MSAKQRIDYDRIEPGWRAGIKSPAQLAAEYTAATGETVSRVAIKKHFEKAGIPRDLKAKVQAKADSMVAASMVTGKVSSGTKARESDVINANAVELASIQLSHRSDIRRGRDVVAKLVVEVGALTDRPDLVQEMTAALADMEGPDSVKGLRDVLDRIMSLPGRVTSVKGLAEALKNLVALERQAWNMDAEDPALAVGGRELSDLERASRLASILDRARRAKAETSDD
jgi:hypothetical protein